MNTPKHIPLLTAAALLSGSLTAQAATINWDGDAGDGLWRSPTNWSTDTVPVLNGTDDAFLNASAVYDAQVPTGSDFFLNGGSTLTVQNGGAWSQTNGIAWIQAGGGNLVIDAGGSFDTGTAGNMIRDDGTSITVNGSFTYGAGNFIFDPTSTGAFSVGSNATFSVSSEFQPLADFTFNNGVTYTGGSVLASNNVAIVTVNGANLSLVDNGPSIAGLFAFDGINNYIDFTTNGGIVQVSNVDGGATEVENAINNGLYRYEGAIDPTNISYTDLGGGNFQITAVTVPEPATYALLLGMATLGALALRRKRA